MTSAQPPETAPPPRPPLPTPARARRVVEWFWGGAELAALRAARPAPSEETLELRRRAIAALELGRQALEPAQPVEHGPVDDLVCQILAQSIHWALLAQRSWKRNGAHEAAPAGSAAGGDLGVLLAEADPQLLARAAGGQHRATALAQAIAGKSFADYAAMPRGEQRVLAERLLSFAQALCGEIDPTGADTGRIWARRLLRLGLVVVGAGLLYLGGVFIGDRVERAHDLARGKPWVASSRYPTYGCTSPAQDCENSDVYFFSTDLEENPRIEWDLGKPQAVSGVRVDNRVDCCSDRAVPLVVEVSLDHATWREVARRTEEFTTWKARFAPAQARWVRLRVPGRSMLHLVRVRILR